jgi:hypothetical protein
LWPYKPTIIPSSTVIYLVFKMWLMMTNFVCVF